MIKKDITKVIEISKEEYAELQRDSYKAEELGYTVNKILKDIEDILWKDSIGIKYDFVSILKEIKEDIEDTLEDINTEPEEED